MNTVPNQFNNTAMSAKEFIQFLDEAILAETAEQRQAARERFARRLREVREAQEKTKGLCSNN